MKYHGRVLSVIIVAAVIAGFAASAHAQAFLYAGKRKKVNCGIVWTSANNNVVNKTGAEGGVGDLFYLLESRADMKPSGWSFENPLAPTGSGSGVSKANPNYWRIDVESRPDLSRMHVLYFPGYGKTELSEDQRETLRKFVDGGGVLWIDNASSSNPLNFGSTMSDDPGTFFISGLWFERASGYDFAVSRHHPLLTLPFWLSEYDIANLGADPGKAVCRPGYDPRGVGGWGGVTSQPTAFDVLYPVVANSEDPNKPMPSVAANAYGSGCIVATANYVGRGCYLNAASLKFAYNVIAWSASWTHLRKDPRHSGASIDTVGGTKLLEMWSLPVSGASGGSQDAVGNAPVIYKNIVFYTAGTRVYALDLVPQEDLDHDGNWDDGYQGVGPGPNKGQDVVWFFDSPGGKLSPPSVVTVQDPRDPSRSIDVVLVAAASGEVYMLPAFPVVGDPPRFETNMPITPLLVIPGGQGKGNSNPGPPLYVNGWIYTVGGDGRLYAYNPSLRAYGESRPNADPLAYEWCMPTDIPGIVVGQAEPRTGPSFGYVTSSSNGATVGVVYWFAGPWQTNPPPPGGEQNDHVYAVPVYVANDRVKIEKLSSDKKAAECRISYRGFISQVPQPVAYVIRSGGAEEELEVFPNSRLVGDQIVRQSPNDPERYMVVRSRGADLELSDVVRATYALDYGSSEGVQNAAHRNPWFPLEPRSNSQNGVPKTTIVSMPAMGPDNMIFFAGQRGDGNSPSAVYALTNDGNSQSSRWIYMLHGLTPEEEADKIARHVPPGIRVPGVVYHQFKDPATGQTRFEWMLKPKVYSSPAVWQDKVFVTVSGQSADGRPTAALMCFKADSDFVIRITETVGQDESGNPIKRPKSLLDPATGRRKQILLWQPNLMDIGGSVTTLPLQSAQPASPGLGVSINYEKGTITFDTFDKMKLRGGPLNLQSTNCFSPSLPVWVFVDNVEVPIDWSTWGPTKAWWSYAYPDKRMPFIRGDSVDLSGWNNLLWFWIVPQHEGQPCSGIHSSPVVIGGTVYFVCDDGHIFAYPAEPRVESGRAIDPVIWEGKISGAAGAANFSIAGSNGVILIPTPDGLHAYTNATTLVADSNRLVEVDGAGEVRWEVGSISWPVSVPKGGVPAMTSGPVNKPTRAKYLPSGEILLVNSGANQVCRIDRSGVVGLGGLAGKYIRGIYDKFVDPKNLLRPGQPTHLSGPTDAIFWQDYELVNNVVMRVDHCVIADSGNHRVLDLVYRFKIDANTGMPTELVVTEDPGRQPDPATGFYLPELNWVTVTDSVNERYVYECLQLVPSPTGGQDIYAAVSNYRGSLAQSPPNNVQTEGLGGAIFALSYRVPGPTGTSWDYSHPNAGRIVAACDRILVNGQTFPLAGPRFFQVVDRQAGRFILICDNYGVYEVGPITGGVPPVTRALRDQDYRNLSRDMTSFPDGGIAGSAPIYVPLMASSVQELINGNWLITNSYSGSNTAGDKSFSGEVFEVSWKNDGTVNRIEWCSPGLYVLGNDLSTWKQRLENSYIFQQPRFAVRQM